MHDCNQKQWFFFFFISFFLVCSPMGLYLTAIMHDRPVKDGNHEAMFNSPRAGFEPTSIWSPSGNFCLNFSPAFILIPSGHFASELLISLFGTASSSEIECKFLFKYPSFQLLFVLVRTCQEAAINMKWEIWFSNSSSPSPRQQEGWAVQFLCFQQSPQ